MEQYTCAICGKTEIGTVRVDGSPLWPDNWWRMIPDSYTCGQTCRAAFNEARRTARAEPTVEAE